jgi:hypothetical protein
MRTTVDSDDPILREVKALQEKEGRSRAQWCRSCWQTRWPGVVRGAGRQGSVRLSIVVRERGQEVFVYEPTASLLVRRRPRAAGTDVRRTARLRERGLIARGARRHVRPRSALARR